MRRMTYKLKLPTYLIADLARYTSVPFTGYPLAYQEHSNYNKRKRKKKESA